MWPVVSSLVETVCMVGVLYLHHLLGLYGHIKNIGQISVTESVKIDVQLLQKTPNNVGGWNWYMFVHVIVLWQFHGPFWIHSVWSSASAYKVLPPEEDFGICLYFWKYIIQEKWQCGTFSMGYRNHSIAPHPDTPVLVVAVQSWIILSIICSVLQVATDVATAGIRGYCIRVPF